MRKGEQNETEGDGEDTHIEKLSEDTMNLSSSIIPRQIMPNQFTVEVSTTEHVQGFLFPCTQFSLSLSYILYSIYALSC